MQNKAESKLQSPMALVSTGRESRRANSKAVRANALNLVGTPYCRGHSGIGMSTSFGHFLPVGLGMGISEAMTGKFLPLTSGTPISAALVSMLPAIPIMTKNVDNRDLIMLLFRDLGNCFVLNALHRTIAYPPERRGCKGYVFRQRNDPSPIGTSDGCVANLSVYDLI
jgi:hypothetical protein